MSGGRYRRVRHVRRNEERFTFAHEMIDDAVAFADAHFDVALELIKILLRIDQMKIVPRVRPLDDHDEKIAPIVKIAIADRRLKFVAVLFDPILEIDRRLHGRHISKGICSVEQRQTCNLCCRGGGVWTAAGWLAPKTYGRHRKLPQNLATALPPLVRSVPKRSQGAQKCPGFRFNFGGTGYSAQLALVTNGGFARERDARD